MSELTDYL